MLIRSEEIYKKANRIVKTCGTRDTLKIARELGIYVHFIDEFNELLGMYTYRHKERHILLNSSMEDMVLQMVCGHEIFQRILRSAGNFLRTIASRTWLPRWRFTTDCAPLRCHRAKECFGR